MANVTLKFTRSDNVSVIYEITILDITNLNENFTILNVTGIDTPIERRLFYQFDKRNWTLNEFIYFANNNLLCILLTDSIKNLTVNYGVCS